MLHRDRRAAEVIRAEVAKIITSELTDPNLGFVTVVGVKITKDLKRAVIFISVIGDAEKKKLTLEHLEHAKGHIRSLLRHRVTMRYLPDLHFEHDTLFEQERRVSELIDELHRSEAAPVTQDQQDVES
jgi:ribosome-binding factor A